MTESDFATKILKSVKSQHNLTMGLPKGFCCQLVLLLLHLLALGKGVRGISCYVCSSKNKSDVYCEDPFHPAHSVYSQDCQVPKEGHIGQFPANYCVKIIGTSVMTRESLMIRTCVLENMDSQCGVFKFGGEQLTGCILTCTYDGCNAGPPGAAASRLTLFLLPLSLLFSFHILC